MYDEDKQDDTIQDVNDEYEAQSFDKIKQENETLKKMVESRNAELQKPKEITEDKILALSNVLGINKMKEQIDELNNGQNQIIGKLSEVINSMNSITQSINGNHAVSNSEAPAIGDPMEKIQMLSSIFDKGLELYKTFKSNSAPPENVNNMLGIDQSWIMEQVGNSVKRKFELGDKIYDTVESVLTKKTTNKVVNAALENKIDTDEPA